MLLLVLASVAILLFTQTLVYGVVFVSLTLSISISSSNLSWMSNRLPSVTQYCFRAGNRSSEPDFGRILIGKASKSALRPAEGRPEGRG
jgi:hypothetical protein